MKPRADAPAGLETDGQGQVIPVEKRTLEDRVASRGEGVKDPDGDAAEPASMPDGAKGGSRGRHDDPAGQQGGTQGGGRDHAHV